jgi:hypothetical protein
MLTVLFASGPTLAAALVVLSNQFVRVDHEPPYGFVQLKASVSEATAVASLATLFVVTAIIANPHLVPIVILLVFRTNRPVKPPDERGCGSGAGSWQESEAGYTKACSPAGTALAHVSRAISSARDRRDRGTVMLLQHDSALQFYGKKSQPASSWDPEGELASCDLAGRAGEFGNAQMNSNNSSFRNMAMSPHLSGRTSNAGRHKY